MNQLIYSILTIVILTVIIYGVYIYFFTGHNEDNIEGFWGGLFYSTKYCSECGHRSHKSCSKCNNCGFCITRQGHGECVQGDRNGPYFRKDCVIWDYGKKYSQYPLFNIYGYNYPYGYNRYVHGNNYYPYLYGNYYLYNSPYFYDYPDRRIKLIKKYNKKKNKKKE